MGLSKANELLLLGRKISAKTALEWNICSKIDHDCDISGGDPFKVDSLGSRMCTEIDQRLLSLPQSRKTVEYFVAAVKGRRRRVMEQTLRDELTHLDERFDGGDVQDAARTLRIGSKL